jgi:hypothetical protein
MTNSSRLSGKSLRFGMVTAFAALTMLGSASGAQTPATEDGPHPAHIHAGTCDALGDVVAPLADVASMTGEEMGAAGGHPVKMSEWTNVAVPLQTILDGGHAINVHLSADDMGTSIACGNIGGIVHERENGEGMEIAFALAEQNDSGHVGIAWLGDDGQGGTNVSVSLIEPEAMN